MMKRIFLFLLLFPVAALAQRAIPEHGGVWVHDEAHVLSAGAKVELESILKAERDSTTNQIAVLIVPSLDGEALEDYTLRVAENWKLGKKDTDNGVLLFISIADRKVRIEVGQGHEGQLTDVMSSRINRNEIAPHFRQGDYDGGVKAGVMAIIQVIKGQYKNNEPVVSSRRKSRSPWTTLIVIIVIIIAAASRKRGGGSGGAYWAAGSLFGSGMGGGGNWGSGGGGGSDYGGGGSFGGGGSSDSW